jgi:hypothetical protein
VSVSLLAVAVAVVVVVVVVDREEESNSVGFGVWKLFTSDVVEEMSKSKAAINRTSMCAAALWEGKIL